MFFFIQSKLLKENYVEKVSHDFSPYYALDQFDLLEEEIWLRGSNSTRSAYAWMRHRMCLLYTTCGILR
jgi:hypothetical protein